MKSLNTKILLPALLALSTAVAACGGSKEVPDAGPVVDTSCGIDCALQEEYGLIANRCFEYSDDNAVASPPDLGVGIEGVVELEGGQMALRAVYFRAGQRLLEDTFLLTDGDLKLARRSDPRNSRSVNYTDEADQTVGVTLVQADSEAGQSIEEAVTAVVSFAGTTEDPTIWRVNTLPPTISEKATPLQTFEDGVTFTYNETPDHAMDPRLVFVRGTGFIQRNTRLSLDPAELALPYKLQGVRELTAETLSTCGSAS